MKHFTIIVGLLFATGAQAAIIGAPFLPEVDTRFNNIEQSLYSAPESGNSGISVSHHVKGIFNISASGTYTATNTLLLPQNAIIQQAFWYSSASGTPPSGTTLAFQCDAANDVYTATDISTIQTNAITAGVETGTAATMHLVTTSGGCTPKAVLGVHNVTAGVVNLFLDYVLAK